MKIKALIAVRSGSVRVNSKNIRSFAGSTLLDCKIRQLLRLKNLDGIVVNSNDEKILKIASHYDVELIKRADMYASNDISMSEVYKNMAENMSCDVIMYSNVTNPLIEDSTIEMIIDKYSDTAKVGYDSINTVHVVKEFMFRDGKPLNYDLKHQPRSQDLPDIFFFFFAISMLRREDMIKHKNVVGLNPYLFEVSEEEAFDIDSMMDFEVAEFLYRKKFDMHP